MPTTTALQAVPVPVVSDNPTIPAHMLGHVQYMEKRLVMRFTDTTDRDAKITSPENGMVAYLSTAKVFTFHDGTGWKNLIANLLSPIVQSVDSVNSGGQITLKGAGSNKSWGVKSQGATLVFRYDFEGTPSDVLVVSQTAVTIPVGKTFVREGIYQGVIRYGTGAPSNGTGLDGDIYFRIA